MRRSDGKGIVEKNDRKGRAKNVREKAGVDSKISEKAGSEGDSETGGKKARQERWRETAGQAKANRIGRLDMDEKIANLRHNALRNALYHTARRRTFERRNRFFNFIVILLGAAAIADAAKHIGVEQMWIGLAVAAVGALQLVVDFGGLARTHQSLQREYYNVLAEIEECTDADDAKCAGWQGKMARIAGDEPPVLRALDAKAYNDAIDAMEHYPRDQRLYVPLIHRLAGGFLSFEGKPYDKMFERAAKPRWYQRLRTRKADKELPAK